MNIFKRIIGMERQKKEEEERSLMQNKTHLNSHKTYQITIS